MELESKEILELAKAAKDGKIEVTILRGEAKKVLDEVAPIEIEPLKLAGDISTVHNFLKVRSGLFKPDNCHIKVNRNDLFISFIGNEQRENDNHKTQVLGKMNKSKEYENLPIDKRFTPQEFAKFVRRNKHMFSSAVEWRKVFLSYSNFKAKVDREVESSKNQSGSASEIAVQKVQANIIQEFDLMIPLIEGGEKMTIKVEIDIEPDLTCSLFAPDIERQFKEEADRMLSLELEKLVGEKPMREFCVTYFI